MRIIESHKNLNNLDLARLKQHLVVEGVGHNIKEKADIIETYVFTDSKKPLSNELIKLMYFLDSTISKDQDPFDALHNYMLYQGFDVNAKQDY